MCGIAGALVFKNSSFEVSDEYLCRLRDSMSHRGPDGAGVWSADDRRVGFGHRRLSIIDLSDAAAQPMSNAAGTLWVTFNGEIYNHAEIRAELVSLGHHTWKTDHSDTEVIIHAFAEWGIACLERFRGMFAFALWDARERELWLVRDRLGVKPLYYSVHHGRITFASEIKALLEDPDQTRVVDEEAFFHYLSFLTSPAPQTLFAGIKKLPAGTWLKVTADGEITEHRYWDVWDHTISLDGMDENDVAEQLLSELRTAVKLRKVSDVPVGVFLSGGIDSSTNAALFSEGESGQIKTFSIGYEGEYESYKNELHYARKVAGLVNAEHHECLLNIDDLIEFLPQMVRLQDEPIADPVCVPVYYVSKLARDNGVVVCQVGEGADELFCGYPGWKNILQLQRLNDLPVPRFMKRLGLLGMKALNMDESFSYERLRRGALGQPVFWGGAEAFTECQKRRLMGQRLRKNFAGVTSWDVLRPIRQRFEEKAWEKSHLNWMSYLDLNLRLPELLLMRVDKMSMGVGLEGRVPFLDHKFVEFVMSIPETMKTKDGVLKYIFKKSVHGLVPDQIINREKQGFAVPIYEWFFGKLGERITRELNSFCDETDFLDRAEVLRLHDCGKGQQLWYVLNFAMWWKQYVST